MTGDFKFGLINKTMTPMDEMAALWKVSQEWVNERLVRMIVQRMEKDAIPM